MVDYGFLKVVFCEVKNVDFVKAIFDFESLDVWDFGVGKPHHFKAFIN